MAELVAGAFLTVMFEKLFERFASPEFRKNSTGDQLKQLESKLKMARLLLDDAEDRQLSEPSVKEWLDDLKHVVFQADDLAEEINNNESKQFGRKSVTRVVKSTYHSLVGTIQGEMGVISSDLDDLSSRATILGLKHRDSTGRERGSSPIMNTPLREEHHVFGRNDDRDKILELMLSDEFFGGHRIGVVPIVGMGGLGKTTLARLVYDDSRVKEPEFELRAWVTVSTEFDVFRVIKTILQQISPGVSGSEVEEPTELQRKMKEALQGKKFLFALDDVWDENYDKWDLLMSNFSTGASGSRMIVTTRSREVGSVVKTGPIHELTEVSDDDCWSIFSHHAFSGGDLNSDPRLHEIGKRIVEKCKGLPLAVKAIGGLLRSERTPEIWESILSSHVWEWNKNNNGSGVLPSLWLSYRYLPSSLKQCFAYCSIFPQDYEFLKKQMILLWMAEGFFPSNERETRPMEEIGDQYFDALVSRSLFQRSSRDESKFVIHDIVHDLAAFVSGDFCFGFATENAMSRHVTTRTHHLSHSVPFDSNLWTSVSKAKHLRSFLSLTDYGDFPNEFVKKLITKQSRLRVLSLFTRDPKISASFGNLKHLRYLNLSRSNIHEVPSSVCTLFRLQTLLLSNCRNLTQLPKGITKLMKLRHLDITKTNLTHMPPHVGNLKELRTLTDFFVGDSNGSACSDINAIKELPHLTGKLHIWRLQNLVKLDQVGKDILGRKENLKKLVLEWSYSSETRREAKDVLNGLQPHTNLEKLVVCWYPASSFPIWVGEISFSKMVSVKLKGGLFNSLPPLGQLPSLRKLKIGICERVEKIGLEFYGNNSSVTPFQCLETLNFYYMDSVKEWVFVDKAFPHLKNLSLLGIPYLDVSSIDCKTIESFCITHMNALECFPLDKFPMLRDISFSQCSNLKTLASDGNSESLTSMVLERCPEMESFPEAGLPKSLNHLRIDDCAKLIAGQSNWALQKLPSLMSLEICNCDSAPSELFSGVLLPNSLTSLTLSHLRGIKSLNGSAFQQAKSLEHLSIAFCEELESLPEKELLGSLCTLIIVFCGHLEIKYQKNKGKRYQDISHIPELYITGYFSKSYEVDEYSDLDDIF